MSAVAMRDNIVLAFERGLSSLGGVKVIPHGGRFAKGELQRLALSKAPQVLVACLGLPGLEMVGGSPEGICIWAAYVLAGSRREEERGALALSLVSQLLPLIPGNDWDVEGAGVPERISADNLYSGEIDRVGMALWAINWQQTLPLGQVAPADLALFETCHVDWDLAAPDGAIDAVDHMTLPQD